MPLATVAVLVMMVPLAVPALAFTTERKRRRGAGRERYEGGCRPVACVHPPPVSSRSPGRARSLLQ